MSSQETWLETISTALAAHCDGVRPFNPDRRMPQHGQNPSSTRVSRAITRPIDRTQESGSPRQSASVAKVFSNPVHKAGAAGAKTHRPAGRLHTLGVLAQARE